MKCRGGRGRGLVPPRVSLAFPDSQGGREGSHRKWPQGPDKLKKGKQGSWKDRE